MILRVNGEETECPPNITLAAFLAGRRLDARSVVVEHNRSIVSAEDWETIRLSQGDELEILHFVGGG